MLLFPTVSEQTYMFWFKLYCCCRLEFKKKLSGITFAFPLILSVLIAARLL